MLETDSDNNAKNLVQQVDLGALMVRKILSFFPVWFFLIWVFYLDFVCHQNVW